MATTFLTPLVYKAERQEASRTDRRFGLWLTIGLTLLAVALHGYHPYAEDGGLYLAGVKRLLDPALYPRETAFVVEHLRFSVFAPVVAAIVRGSGLGVETVMFLLYVTSFWATLFAVWELAARCYEEQTARIGAVALLATWLTLPVAGTSLMLMDPYVTARSITTPCTLFALVGTLDLLREGNARRGFRLLLAVCALLAGILFHPLMAVYGLGCALVLAAMLLSRRLWLLTLGWVCIASVLMASMLRALSGPENADYVQVAMTRTYWFLSLWHWYEWVGLAAPLALLAFMVLRWRDRPPARLALVQMALAVGIAATAVSLIFARVGSTTHLVARLQPLRVFQVVYVVMILMVGAELGRHLLRRNAARWVTTFAALAAVMLIAERQVFPASAHIELPANSLWRPEGNPWVQAFLWVKRNTPKNALLALDANYIEQPGEDAQCFRAIAERSALPDYSKDGGEASITPSLAKEWIRGESAQTGLSAETDEERIAALKPLGVDWVVLETSATTGFACVYTNEAVKVCRMPGTPSDTMISSRSPASLRLAARR